MATKPDWCFPVPLLGTTKNPGGGKCRHKYRKSLPCRHLGPGNICKAKLWCLSLNVRAPEADLSWLRSRP